MRAQKVLDQLVIHIENQIDDFYESEQISILKFLKEEIDFLIDKLEKTRDLED